MLQGHLKIPDLAKQINNDPLGTLWSIAYGAIEGIVEDATALAKLHPLWLGVKIINGDVYGAAKDICHGLFTAFTYLNQDSAVTKVLKGVLGNADDVGQVAANIDDVGDVGKATSHANDLKVGPRNVANGAAGTAAKRAPVEFIGRLDDLKDIPRQQTLLDDLPDLGSPRANYYQNSSVLRKALRDGFKIRDASAFRPNSELAPSLLWPDRTLGQTFLGAERLILDNKGLKLSPSGAYVPK